MCNKASELSNGLLETYSGEYYYLSDSKSSNMDPKYDIANLILVEYDYSGWYNELDDLPPLEGDEEKYYTASSTQLSKRAKQGKGLKILQRHSLIIHKQMMMSMKIWKTIIHRRKEKR